MSKPITHRCKGSLKARTPIRFQSGIFEEKPRWWLINVDYDEEFMFMYLEEICPIKYCQFCGEELKEPDKEK